MNAIFEEISIIGMVLSVVVANNRMNRERNASGVNSYEKDLRFHPEQYLKDYLQRFGYAKHLVKLIVYNYSQEQEAIHDTCREMRY